MVKTYYELPECSAILSSIDAIFVELNMGLFIYHMEDREDVNSLRLIYANKEASKATGANLQGMVGQYISDAFPNLAQTEIPKIFSEVVIDMKPRRIEQFEYGDTKLEKASYRVKAFPMPVDCVGVLFERT